jgi:hypothetical protein
MGLDSTSWQAKYLVLASHTSSNAEQPRSATLDANRIVADALRKWFDAATVPNIADAHLGTRIGQA